MMAKRIRHCERLYEYILTPLREQLDIELLELPPGHTQTLCKAYYMRACMHLQSPSMLTPSAAKRDPSQIPESTRVLSSRTSVLRSKSQMLASLFLSEREREREREVHS